MSRYEPKLKNAILSIESLLGLVLEREVEDGDVRERVMGTMRPAVAATAKLVELYYASMADHLPRGGHEAWLAASGAIRLAIAEAWQAGWDASGEERGESAAG